MLPPAGPDPPEGVVYVGAWLAFFEEPVRTRPTLAEASCAFTGCCWLAWA
jgi:hypothetical protein